MDQTVFFSYIGERAEARNIFRFITSLRRYGGLWKDSPVWVLAASPDLAAEVAFTGVEVFPCEADLPRYLFASKTAACAQAEALAGEAVSSLVWVNPETLIVRPPDRFDLDLPATADAAFRPVHIRNVGLLASQPLDGYWAGVNRSAGLDSPPFTVETFVDGAVIQPYFNTHVFAVRPAKGLMRTWWTLFQQLIEDQDFQASTCSDTLHRIFLHQAVLSALLAKEVPQERLRLLPPTYSYPLHLHNQAPPARRPECLDDLVCAVYEDGFAYPDTLNGLDASPELAAWLK